MAILKPSAALVIVTIFNSAVKIKTSQCRETAYCYRKYKVGFHCKRKNPTTSKVVSLTFSH